MNAWIDAGEKLPTEKGQYLVCLERLAPEDLGGSSRRIRILRWTDEGWRLPRHFPEWINEALTERVTHWQALPEMPKEKAATPKSIKCRICGCNMVWENPYAPGLYQESSCYLGDNWPICHDCMVEHCTHANCLACNYGKYPDCRFLKMKVFYLQNTD